MALIAKFPFAGSVEIENLSLFIWKLGSKEHFNQIRKRLLVAFLVILWDNCIFSTYRLTCLFVCFFEILDNQYKRTLMHTLTHTLIYLKAAAAAELGVKCFMYVSGLMYGPTG